MAQVTEGATDSVEAVWFNFMTTEEVRKHSVLKVTNANLLDFMERPMPGGLYDPVLGPLEDRTPCKSCGLLKLHCPGHCGHIDFVSPIYNPLLFNFLHTIIQRTCFFCYHLRADRTEVERCVSQLKLIGKGDLVGAKRLDLDSRGASSYPEYSEGSQELDAMVHDSEAVNPKEWTSLQLTEAVSVLNSFLKLKYKKCKNCDAKNPAITKPTFGWFHMSGMSGAQMRENVIRGCTMAGSFSGEAGSGIEDANDASSSENGVDIAETNTTETGFIGAEDTSAKARKKKAQVHLEFMKQKNLFSGPLLPSEVKKITKFLWENEVEICSLISDIQQQGFGKKVGYSMFFLETILVPPIKFRAPTKGGDNVMEHPQTVLLSKVLQANISLGNAYTNNLQSSRVVVRLWMDLQQSVNFLFDSKTAMSQRRDVSPGICQLLEKKEGMFRQKMMGKRVNFACRSVISPDPYLAVNEIGIPPYFALRLTYPERVTPWNIVKLREAIINGSEIHPGATDKLSTQRLPPNRKTRISISRKLPSSRGAIMQSGKNFDYEFEGKIVLRHLQDGDVVLVNRQPTLHKPSIMAHVVRVLKGEKTIRMHYTNCSTYNADFDGDEINVHFPQDEISRAEAYNIVNANNQYVRPSNGEPIRALIQDHIVSSVLLTKRDTFLSRDGFNQLLYSSGVSSLAQSSFSGKPGQKVFVSSSEEGMLSILPAILKPKPLWTGKQRFVSLTFAPAARNDLVRGVIDKAQFADYGLVHTVQELYGSNTAGFLLSMHGFTCGVDDLLSMKDKDIERKKQLEECEKKVTEAHYELFGVKVDTEIAPTELQLKIERNIRRDGEAALSALDRKMIGVLKKNSSQGVLTELLSEGLIKSMGKNCISLMTTSGAKGSKVNFQQISAYLGQQELEGKRVPRMVSVFIVSFKPRFCYSFPLDSLVDTAVKTSHSGYLQRCLRKNLECLKISYDHTVRDVNGSIVQFNYGEDGIDVHQTSFIAKFDELALNQDMMSEKLRSKLGEPDDSGKILPDGLRDKAVQFIKNNRYHKINPKDFLKLLNLKFLSSLAQPGEPVGVLAAQSVGEPSTQMMLNTFHLAGRGEMNVTLGIPCLQEILMTASIDIRTPVMTCPLHKGKTKEDAVCLADKMKKITVADILESMEVSVMPFAVHNGDICSIYKLKMRLGKPGGISGIKNFMPDSRPNASNEMDEDVSESKLHETENDDDTDDEERAEDLGLDAQKQKQQTADEMDYEDGSEEEQNEGA
ncbi:hypothetical protein CRYUN_Cryun08bG0099300 [Craigia yunnanensis]